MPVSHVVAISSLGSVGCTAQERTGVFGAGGPPGRKHGAVSFGAVNFVAEILATLVFSNRLRKQADFPFHFASRFLGSEFLRPARRSWTICVSPGLRNVSWKSVGCTVLQFLSRTLPAGKTHRFCWPTPPPKGSRHSSRFGIAGIGIEALRILWRVVCGISRRIRCLTLARCDVGRSRLS